MKHKSLTASVVMLGVALALSAWGDSTALNISGGTDTVTSPMSTILNFPISRSGDTSYDAFLQYQTVDGTAVAGVDYTAASGSVLIPAGQSSATIPVTVAGRFNNVPNKSFQMQLLGGGGAGMGFTPSFAIQQTFAAGTNPQSLTVADVNGDGKPDLILANFGDNTISVLLNTTAPGATTPTFATQQTFATGNGPYSVMAADLNGDGLPDLIVTNFSDNTVSVLLNTTAPGATTPSFATQQTFATGSHPISVTASDVNGDGKRDLIVANEINNTVSVLLNTTAPGATTPSFATQQTFATGGQPFSVATADVNSDGLPDLIVTNAQDNTVSVLLNTTAPGATTPSFATQQTFVAGTSPESVIAADVNGDGKRDLIVVNEGDNTVSVLLNTTAPGASTPSFATQQTFATGLQPASVTAADLNGDGKPDLIVANAGANTVSVLLNTTVPGASALSFAAQQSFAAGNTPELVAVADLNGDGKLDLIVANEGDSTVSVLSNTMPAPTTTFDGNSVAAYQDFATGNDPDSVTTADINGDGLPDLIVANEDDNTVSVLLNTTALGASIPSFAAQQTFATGSDPFWVTTADVNGDGKPDLIVANFGDNTISVMLNTTAPGATTPSFATQQTFATTGEGPTSVTVADVNGDGLPDLIVANHDDGTVGVLLNTTTPGSSTASFAAQQTFAAGEIPIQVTTADVNGDGLPDLIVADLFGKTVWVLLNTTAPGATTPSFATAQPFAVGSFPRMVTTADLNGDGKPDLIAVNQDDNTASVLLNTTAPGATTPSFATQQTFATGTQPYSVTAADVNGDGKPDLIIANSIDSTISVLLNTTAPGAATPSFATQQTFADNAAASVTAADVNGDGKIDLIVTGDDAVSVLLNSLYSTVASGSPATGTIHYAIPPTTATLSALAFGNVPVGDTVSKNITVKNTGLSPLYVGNVSSNDPEFAETGTTCPGGALAPTMTCTIAVGFTPRGLGAHSTTLQVTDNTASSPQHVAASGTGTVTMTVTPTSYGFGSVKDGSKAVKVIVVHNYQANPVSLSEGFSGPNAADFSVTGGTCTSTLAKASVCTVIVTFAPTAAGAESATMTVTDSPDPLGPYTVSLSSAATIPESVSPAKLAFADVYQTASKTLSVTLTNHSSSEAMTLTGTSVGGANASDFAVTGGTCTGSSAASSSCTYAVTFTPSTETAETGTLSIMVAQDPNGGPAAIDLSGTGLVPVRVVPASIAFGTVADGHSSASRTVTVINDGGAASLSELVSGPNSGDFTVTGGTCGATLAGAGASCTYTLKFTPSIVGPESATLGVSAAGDAASPHNVMLTGAGS